MPADRRLHSQLDSSRRLTDELFQIVHPDAIYERPIPERHRILFYLGHLEAFDWNLLARYALDLPAFHAGFDRLFAFGIDPAAGDLPDDQPSDWPRVPEVESYNRRTREEIDQILDRVPAPMIEAAEGTARQFAELLKSAMGRTWRTKLGYLLAREAFVELRDKMDPRKANGGVFLGLNGIVIKSHGGSDVEGFAAAVDIGYEMVRYGLLARISHTLDRYVRGIGGVAS